MTRTLRRTLLACVLLLAGAHFAACDSGPVGPVIDGTGPFNGFWDGSRWLGRGYAVTQGDTIHIVGHRPDRTYWYDEYVRIDVALDGPGVYELPADGTARLAKITGGDAGWFPGASGTVTIDSVKGRIYGTVELEADGPDGKLWTFKLGRFELPIYSSYANVPNLIPPGRQP